ncbi:MAG: L,D-transpeptidase family protein [Hyphomicrobium sp.]|nr:L,D-transpeptidase family protein [Hyphomicrobium sp.]
MKYWALCVTVAILAGVSERSSANAEPSSATPTGAIEVATTTDHAAPGIAPSAADLLTDRSVGADIRLRLLNDAAKAGEEDAVDWQGLIAFYEGRADEPVFMGRGGYTATAKALSDELAKADAYGLDPKAFVVPSFPDDAPGATPLAFDQRVEGELAFALVVLKYARHARGGRIPDPPKQLSSYLDRAPQYLDPRDVLVSITSTTDPAAALRATHPKHPEFERLRQRYLAMKAEADEAKEIVRIPSKGPKLIPGESHPDVALVRERLGVEMPPAPPPPAATTTVGSTYDAPSKRKSKNADGPREHVYDDVLAAAVAKFQSEKGQKADGIIGSRTRAAFNDIVTPSPERILANMEMWRWMPEDKGDFFVWVNIPEFMVRVVKKGHVIHEERVITGEVSKQTPIFSDELETIYFNPRWNVPQSIKVLELYPGLARGGGSFYRQGLVMTYNGRRVDPQSVNWGKADIRNYDIYQPSGPGNALGIVKFTFPNKHAVYLHDTPTKNLFNAESRPFSHGCMRVRNPMRLAEVLLQEDKGWPVEQVHLTQTSDADEIPIKMQHHIPVHVTYFTTRIADDGTETNFKDVYGHEQRLKLALAGRFSEIAIGPDHLAPVKFQRVEYADSMEDWNIFFGGGSSNIPKDKRRYKQNSSALGDFFNNMFGN